MFVYTYCIRVEESRTRLSIYIQYACSNTERDPSAGEQFILARNRTPALRAIATTFPVALHDTKLLLQTAVNADCSIIVLF